MKKHSLNLCALFIAVLLLKSGVPVLGVPVSNAAEAMSGEEIIEIVDANLSLLNLTGWRAHYPDSDKIVDGVKIYCVSFDVSTVDDTYGSKNFHGIVWVNSATKRVEIEIKESSDK